MELKKQKEIINQMIKLNCKAWLIESKHGKGVSDILVGVGNKLYFVEAKTYSDLSTEQEDFLDYDRTFAVFIKNNKTIFFKKEVKNNNILDGGELITVAESVEAFIKFLRG